MLSTPLATAVVSLLLAGGAMSAPSSDDLQDVTQAALDESVHEWSLDESVHDILLDDSVKSLATEEPVGPDTVITLRSDILFEFNSFVLPPSAPAAIADAIADAPNGATVTVAGHTDNVGEDAANQVLSQQRADAVAAAITQARPDLLITSTGFGESQPIADNSTGGEDNPEGRALNRRVEVTFVTG